MNGFEPTIDAVRSFWNANPLCAAAIEAAPGTPAFFAAYDLLKEANESLSFTYAIHEFPNFAGRRVLDVGCGNGYVLSKYAREGAVAFGVDLSDVAVEITRKRLELLALPADVRVANAEALPFPDDHFDCVSSMGVVHHTPDTQKAVGEVYRVLKPGGRLILMFYHAGSALNRWTFTLLPILHPRFRGMTRQTLINQIDGVGNPKGAVYTKTELAEMLSRFRHVHLFSGLLQPWMIWPIGRFLPRSFFETFEARWGHFLYAKGWK